MRVVFLVTGITRGWGFLFGDRNFMTGLARGCFVLAQQRIFRILVVVEGRGFPALLVVTGVTFRAEYGLVSIVFSVTRDAIGLELVFIEVACMAALAFYGLMLVQQRVCGVPAMVEDNLLPISLRVTGGALHSEAACVLVVLFVAAQAL